MRRNHPAANGGKWIRPSKRWAIYYRDGFACVYCSKVGGHLTLDHIISIDRGGENHEFNLVTCCLSCNSSKQGLNNRRWYQKLRKRGINTEQMRQRVTRLLQKPLDKERGSFLASTRERHETDEGDAHTSGTPGEDRRRGDR